MKKEKGKRDQKKSKYLRPTVTKHKKLKDVTSGLSQIRELGCTRLG